MPDDLGFDELLVDNGLFARLLGKTGSGRNLKLLYGPDLPVVLLVGGPGMGKARLLRCIRTRFGPHTPTAHIDCGSTVYKERAEQDGETRSELTEALREIALQLRAWHADGGRIATPRLYAGLAAIASSGGLDNRATLVDEVRRHDDLLPPGAFWRGVLNRAVRGYLGALTGLVAGPLTVPFTTAVLDELLTRTSQEGRAALEDCWGEYQGAGGHPKLGLHTLASDFQLSGETREYAESFLLRALREDVEAAYHSVRGWLTRVGRPAVLLDRADNTLGRSMLKPVLEDREAGRFDRMVVVATGRRADGGRFLHGPGGPGDGEPAGWLPSEGGLPAWSRPAGGVPDLVPLSRGVLLVRMPALTREQQQRETARLRERGQRMDNAARLRIDNGVQRLSGGRPVFVTELAKATASLRVPEDFTHWALLDATVRPRHDTAGDARADPPVADVLLDDLILGQLPEELPPEHRDQWLDLLSHLSVAHDVECAQTLMRSRQEARDERLSAYQIDELLRDSGWPRCPRHFIGDLGLRHLLMRRLHRQQEGRIWRADHDLLWQRYQSLGDDHPDELFGSADAHGMHHHLAGGDGRAAERATDYLDGTFPTRNTEIWSGELLAIADAPLLGGSDDRRARVLGEIPLSGDARRRRVARLLHAVWLCEDRTRTVDEAVTGTLRQLLERFGEESSHGAEVLNRLAREWSDRAGKKQPLRSCACTKHIG